MFTDRGDESLPAQELGVSIALDPLELLLSFGGRRAFLEYFKICRNPNAAISARTRSLATRCQLLRENGEPDPVVRAVALEIEEGNFFDPSL